MPHINKSERKRVLKAVVGKDLAEQVSAAPIASPTDEPCHAPEHNSDWFGQFATRASALLGTKWAFAVAALVIVVWAAVGPIFHYSDTWQLVINTGTTIVTFLMVFLIQNTQNRDARAINLKLNELIRAIDAARDQMIDIESLSDLELNEIQARYNKIKADMATGETPETSGPPETAVTSGTPQKL
jgi:low affinity Fe/Cu permease